MTTSASSARRPDRGWYVVAAVLAALAVAIGTVLAVWIIRAISGYSVTPFDQEDSTTVTVSDRGVAIWVTPQDGVTACSAVNLDTEHLSLDDGSTSDLTVTDGGRTWRRAGIVKGEPGSKHIVVCGDGQ